MFSYLLLNFNSFSQLTTNTFTGACPTQGNTFSLVTNATVAPLSRSTTTCTSTDDVFNSATLNNTANRNDLSTTQLVQVIPLEPVLVLIFKIF